MAHMELHEDAGGMAWEVGEGMEGIVAWHGWVYPSFACFGEVFHLASHSSLVLCFLATFSVVILYGSGDCSSEGNR